MESNSHPVELDDETWMAMEAWFAEVLPAFAKESEPKIRGDIVSRMVEAQRIDENPTNHLPNADRFTRGPQVTYLRFDDVVWLASFVGGNRPSVLAAKTSREIVLSVAIALGGLFLLALVPRNDFAQLLLVLCMFVASSTFLFVIEPFARKSVFKYMGPYGCSFVCNSALVGMVTACVGFAGILLLNRRSILDFSRPYFSTEYIVVMGIAGILIVSGGIIALAGYLVMRAKIRNNYDLVARILKMPGYEEVDRVSR